MRKLQDLDFADDLCLTNQKLQHVQETVGALLNAALKLLRTFAGVLISSGKCAQF